MAIQAHLDQSPAADSQRRAQRRELRLETSGVVPGTRGGANAANVTIHNISAAGLLLETALVLSEGERLALDLPEAGAVNAVVVWRSERLYGCAFETALGAAALAATQLQAASPRAAAPASTPDLATMPRASGGEALGIRLNRLRREAGLTLADVAATLGVSKPTVWAWEKGKARPLPERLNAIAAALGVAPEMLAPGSNGAGEIDTVIADCRQRIANACGIAPHAVRIMIEV